MHIFGEGGQRGCEQQGERACATWQSDFRDRYKTYKTKSSVPWGEKGNSLESRGPKVGRF